MSVCSIGENMVKYAENIDMKNLIVKKLDWQKMGLQQTRTGYGSRLITKYVVNYEGRIRRIYAICFSNVASYYIIVNKERLFLHL